MKEFLPNEVEKLKTEHARYKKALESIVNRYNLPDHPRRRAEAALNPPTPPPPTITEAEICAALRELNRKGIGCNHSIKIFSDGSASVGENNFYNLHEALDFLKGRANE